MIAIMPILFSMISEFKIFKKENIWVIFLFLIVTYMIYTILFKIDESTGNKEYLEATKFILPGLGITFLSTLVSFFIALFIGLIAGVGRISKNAFFSNLSRTYIEFIRGVPVIILLFTIAFVVVVDVAELFNIRGNQVPMLLRAIIALAIFYGAYIAEVFRAGIESVGRGQIEGGKSLGLNQKQIMRFIILPQAFKNMLPALGNDFISMMKDSSLLSVLAVNDITYKGRLYSSSSFRYQETYLVLTVMYLLITLSLSIFQRRLELKLENSE